MQSLKNNGQQAATGAIIIACCNTLARTAAKAAEHVLESCGLHIISRGGKISTREDYSVATIEFEGLPKVQSAAAVIGTAAQACEEAFLQKYNRVVFPYNKNKKKHTSAEGVQVIEYSHDEDCADLVAKNIVEADEYTSFELLGTGIIGRIKLHKGSGLTVEAALALSGALLAAGISLSDVTNGLSSYFAGEG